MTLHTFRKNLSDEVSSNKIKPSQRHSHCKEVLSDFPNVLTKMIQGYLSSDPNKWFKNFRASVNGLVCMDKVSLRSFDSLLARFLKENWIEFRKNKKNETPRKILQSLFNIQLEMIDLFPEKTEQITLWQDNKDISTDVFSDYLLEGLWTYDFMRDKFNYFHFGKRSPVISKELMMDTLKEKVEQQKERLQEIVSNMAGFREWSRFCQMSEVGFDLKLCCQFASCNGRKSEHADQTASDTLSAMCCTDEQENEQIPESPSLGGFSGPAMDCKDLFNANKKLEDDLKRGLEEKNAVFACFNKYKSAQPPIVSTGSSTNTVNRQCLSSDSGGGGTVYMIVKQFAKNTISVIATHKPDGSVEINYFEDRPKTEERTKSDEEGKFDLNGDGEPDAEDTDGDGNPDTATDVEDNDGDGVPNGVEDIAGTDRDNADTDGDGANDGAENAHGSDPNDSNSKPEETKEKGDDKGGMPTPEGGNGGCEPAVVLRARELFQCLSSNGVLTSSSFEDDKLQAGNGNGGIPSPDPRVINPGDNVLSPDCSQLTLLSGKKDNCDSKILCPSGLVAQREAPGVCSCGGEGSLNTNNRESNPCAGWRCPFDQTPMVSEGRCTCGNNTLPGNGSGGNGGPGGGDPPNDPF